MTLFFWHFVVKKYTGIPTLLKQHTQKTIKLRLITKVIDNNT